MPPLTVPELSRKQNALTQKYVIPRRSALARDDIALAYALIQHRYNRHI